MMIDSGLAGITIMGAVIAILTGFTIIPREVESRTVYPVISKPVQRWQFVLGTFGGAILTNAMTIAMLSVLFFIGFWFKNHRLFDGRLVPAVLMIFAMTVVLSALIIFFSTFMSWIGTIIVSMVVWFIGSYSVFLWDLAMQRSKGVANLPFPRAKADSEFPGDGPALCDSHAGSTKLSSTADFIATRQWRVIMS